MHQRLHRHLFFSILVLCLFLVAPVLAQQSCPATITVQGRTVLCQGESTTLVASSGNGLSYQWIRNGADLPGQTGSTLQVQTSGTYQVRVSGTSCQTVTSAETQITVNPRPNTPNFTVDPTTAACAGTPINFSINAPQTGVTYIWDMGDGNTRRGATVNYTYNVRGTGIQTYSVRVFATNNTTGCESEAVTRDVQVNRRPEISFTEKDNFQKCLPDTINDADISVTAQITNTTQEPYRSDIRSYTVDWGDGSGTQTYTPADFPISNPNPYTAIGDYPITITANAGNGCTEVFTKTYSVSKKPTANFSLNDKKRANESQQPPCVPVIVTPSDSSSGGGLSYKWSIQPQQGWVLESGTLEAKDPVFRFNVSGVYNVELIVKNGCGSDTAQQSIVIGWPQVQLPENQVSCGPTTIDFSSSGPAGGGGPNSMMVDKNLGERISGTINITGPKNFTFSFNSDIFQFRYNFDVPGRYIITAEATNECGSSNLIYQGQPAPTMEVIILQQAAEPTIQQPGVICEGETITLTPTGPGPVYAWYQSNDPNAAPIARGPSFTTPPLAGGTTTYYVAAIDTAQGIECIGLRREVIVRVNPRIANNRIEGESSRNVCKGGTVAELKGTTPTGGDTNAPYSYTWLRSTTGPRRGFTPAPGVNNNPSYTPSEPITTNTWFRRVVRSASCAPDSSNVVEIIAVDPVPASSNTITPATQEICAGDTPAQLVGSTPTGGGGAPYTYLWEISTTGPNAGFVPAPTPNTGENYTVQGNLSGDTWFRRVVTSAGCSTPSAAVKITVFPALANNTITPAQQDVCTGTPPAPLAGSAPTGGNGTYTYQWLVSSTGTAGSFTPAPGTNNQQSYTPGNITQTTYFQRVVTSGGCTPNTSTTVVINVRPGITNNSISASQTICSGQVPAQLTGPAPTGGTGSFTYRWESSISGPASGFSPAPGTNTGQSYTPPALTRETWFRRVAMSQGCENASEAVRISITPLPENPRLTVREGRACEGGSATLTIANPVAGTTYEWFEVATGGTPVFVGETFNTPPVTQNTTYYVQATNTNRCTSATRTAAPVTVVRPVANAGNDVTIIQGKGTELRASGGATYRWEPATGLSNPNVANPVASPTETTTYTVTVTTAEGCEATDEVTVTVMPAVRIPNAFSPNGDTFHDVWEIENIQSYPDVRVEIFNRWGNQIFTSTGYTEPWDGKHNGKDLPVATYYYIIYLNSTERPISGNVTIVR